MVGRRGEAHRGESSSKKLAAPSDKVRDNPARTKSPNAEPGEARRGSGDEVTGTRDESSDGEDEPVLCYSKQQRWPEAGEPVCVVCGRYGAYIVDRTDQDVCSLECKAKHLLKLRLPLYPVSAAATPTSTPTSAAIEPAGAGEEAGPSGGWSYREHPQVAGLTSEQVSGLRKKVCGKTVT